MRAKIMALILRSVIGFTKKILQIVKEEEEVAAGKIETRVIALVSDMVSEGKSEVVKKVEVSLPVSYA